MESKYRDVFTAWGYLPRNQLRLALMLPAAVARSTHHFTSVSPSFFGQRVSSSVLCSAVESVTVVLSRTEVDVDVDASEEVETGEDVEGCPSKGICSTSLVRMPR